MSKNSINVLNARRNRRNNLIRLLGGKCCLCGYDKCDAALDFHHINPEEKEYGLGSGNCHSLEKDLQEVKKCILICANCHREIHHSNLYDNIDLFQYQIFSSEVLEELQQEKKEYKCKNCGASITAYSRSGLCVSCAQSSRYRHEVNNKPSREELKNLIREKSFVEIGKIYGVTDNAIRKWCDKENLPRTKKVIESYTDEQWIKI